MLPVLMLVFPPSVAGGGYACWFLGQQTALLPTNKREAPIQSPGSYMAGITTLVGVYGLQSTQFPQNGQVAKNSTSKFVPPQKQARDVQFQPPKSMAEALQRMGRPVFMRVGAGGVAFFCAGVVQTFVARGKAIV